MLNVRKENISGESVVYDISLDGTFVNALGMNVLHNTDGFNFQLPDDEKFRFTETNPYIGKGLNREVKEGKAYIGYEADVAEFNDLYMSRVYNERSVQKMGLGIDEIVSSTINFSRKNYADYFPENPFPKDVKMVGNTIKSKKMPDYIAKFLSKGVRLLLKGDGQNFIEEYYAYVDSIYNYRIPIRDIATKGKIKKSIKQYKKDVCEITKAGRPKSRQAWYELAIAENLNVDNGDTLYYVNTGKSKSHADVKKTVLYIRNGEDVTKEIEKGYREYSKEEKGNPAKLSKNDWIAKNHKDLSTRDEITLNCMLIPRDVIDSERDVYCDELNIEYNSQKYVSMFNNRIKPLLVCFSREVRSDILVTNPDDRKFFTEDQCKLVSGEPNKPEDQDTYEQLMTMEDKEILFWTTYDMVPPFLEECRMGKWEDIVRDYHERKERERLEGIDKEKELYESILYEMTTNDLLAIFDEYELPKILADFVTIDKDRSCFVSKKHDGAIIGHLSDITDICNDRNGYLD